MRKRANNFKSVLIREMVLFSSFKTFSRLAISLPVFSFLFFILLFKAGVPSDMPVAVYDQDQTSLSRQLTRIIDATPAATVAYKITDMAEGERMMKSGEIDAIIFIPRNLEKDVYSNTQTAVVAYINGLSLTKNGILNRDIQTALTSFSSGIQIQTLMKQGLTAEQAYAQAMPIFYEKHILFNPFVNYGYYLLPTFLPLMLMLFTLITTIFTIGVELKNGTAAEWLATAGGNPWIALTGKLLPYTVIFFSLALLMDTLIFKFLGVPLRGSVSMIFITGLVYVLATQSVGVVIITLLSNLRLGLSIGGGYSVLAFTFSGLTFPFMAMSLPLHIMGYTFPLTFYMEIFIDQGMRGAAPIYSIDYLLYLSLFLILPFFVLGRLHRICTDEKYWGKF